MLVWLFTTLIGGGVVAAGLVVYLRRPQEKAAAHVDVAAEQVRPTSNTASEDVAEAVAPSTTQTSGKTAPSQSDDDKTRRLQEPVKSSREDDNIAASTKAAPPAQTLPTKADEPLGIVGNSKQGLPDDEENVLDQEPASLAGTISPQPDPVAAADEPTPPVVANVPGGLYAARTQQKTAEFLGARGGTIESQRAVENGLDWLARHQGRDGHWGADCLGPGPSSCCNRKAPCQGTGWAFDVAHTGLALLAFQAAGHYDFNGQEYSRQVNRGIVYLLTKQEVDGSFVDPRAPNRQELKEYPPGAHVGFMYEHAIATFALCEACAVATAEGKRPNPRLQLATQRAVSYMEELQHDDGGWRYLIDRNEQSDCSVSGWVMLALKTAREAKLNVSAETISRMMEFFAAHYADGRTYYQYLGRPSTDAMTAVGMMAVEFFENKLDSPIVQSGAAYLADQAEVLFDQRGAPATSALGAIAIELREMNPEVNMKRLQRDLVKANWGLYVSYNCTMAMFQVGGDSWKRWNDSVRDPIIRLQVGDVRKLEEKGMRMIGGSPADEGVVSCERGSWSFSDDPYGDWGGRIYTTALAVLTLEVYYRFQRVAGQPEQEKFFEK